MSEWTQFIVTIAATLYVIDWLSKRFVESFVVSAKQKVEALETLRDKTADSIESSFELWWQDGAQQTALEKFYADARTQLPGHLPDDVVKAMTEPISEFFLDNIKSNAFMLAVQSNMLPEERKLLEKLPRRGGIRQKMMERREQHESKLNEVRSVMMDYGINPIDLEAHFAQEAA